MLRNNLKCLLIAFVLFSCTSQIKVINQDKEIDFLDESTIITIATRITEIEGVKGFIVNDLKFCKDDVEYRFESFDKSGNSIEDGFYFGIGRIPYLVELNSDAYYVLIYKD